MIQPVQYIIADHSLGMSPGKLAAQVAHASVEGLRLNAKETWGNPWDASIVNLWYSGGHYAKIVLESDDLPLAYSYLTSRGFPCASIIDEGRTEFERLTQTALGFPVVDKNSQHVRDSFSQFKLYGTSDEYKRRNPLMIVDGSLTATQVEQVRQMHADGDSPEQIKEWLHLEKTQTLDLGTRPTRRERLLNLARTTRPQDVRRYP